MGKLIDLKGATVTVPAGWSASSGFGSFNLNYISNSYECTELMLGYKADKFGGISSGDNSIVFSKSNYPMYSVVSTSSFIVEFIDGVDASNQTLIQWLLDNNATIEGGVYEEDNEEEPIVCSITLNAIEPFEDYCENMQYSFADSVAWSNMSDLSFPATFNKFEIAFKNNDTEHSFGIFSNGTLMVILNPNDIYTYTAIGHDTLELRIMRTSITYNGVEVATFPKGKTATIKCENKKMTSDIVITFGANGSITYKGIETAVQAGQTATLKCGGKKMTENLLVSVAQEETEKKLVDLTGATVTVPANWTANSSYGIFNIDMNLDDFGWVNTYIYIGYKLNDNDPFENPITNNNSICVPTTPQGLFSQQSFRIQIRGGVDATNPNLIQWFLDNNATIEGGVWE